MNKWAIVQLLSLCASTAIGVWQIKRYGWRITLSTYAIVFLYVLYSYAIDMRRK